MSGAPKASVIVAVRNSGGLIRETLDALFAQSLTDIEVIVVDDASTDDTPELLASYADPRLRVVRNATNLGIAASRNRALELARAPYAAINDHDDVSAPDRLARQVAWLDAHPGVALLATGAVVLENGRTRPDNDRHVADSHALAFSLFARSVIFHSTVCLRMAALNAAGVRYRPRFDYAEDVDLYHQIVLKRAGSLAWLPEPLLRYRRHAGNTSAVRAAQGRAAALAALAENLPALGARLTGEEIELLWRLVAERKPAASLRELDGLGAALERLADAYCAFAGLGERQRAAVDEQAAFFWWECCRAAARSLGPGALRAHKARPDLARGTPALSRLIASARAIARI